MTHHRALFVAYAGHLEGHGGVQLCTAEFIDAIKVAGFELEVLAVMPDRRISTRALRRAFASPYFRPLSSASIAAIRARAPGNDYVFLNQMNLTGGLHRSDLSNVPAVGLSHGCEITDQLHLARLRRHLPLSSAQLRPHPTLALARTLRDELAARKALDGVICIAPFDADCERWLGTTKVCWVPRTVRPSPLVRQPITGRFGTVGTLDHAPNLDGLVSVLTEIERTGNSDLTVRVVGGPERLGQWLKQNYCAVQYLGPLDQTALAAEAATWNGFIHPIFCLPRGCSTKLSGAMAWALPIVTTPEGRRGYIWGDGALLETTSAATFVTAMRNLTSPYLDAEAAAAVTRAAASSPTTVEVAQQIAVFLQSIAVAER